MASASHKRKQARQSPRKSPSVARQKTPKNNTAPAKENPATGIQVAQARISKKEEFNSEQVSLLRRTIARGTSDDEFALFMWVARKHKLDPFTRQLHCVMRYNKKHHKDEKGIWVGGYQMTIQIGIDGYRMMAARDHKDFGGVDEPEYEYEEGGQILRLARVRVWKKGFDHPTVGIAYWKEYAPTGDNFDDSGGGFMWKKMPHGQLAKCAEALALRKAYPDLSDIYTDEEMAQADSNRTPEGRVITQDSTVDPRQEVADRKIAEYKERIANRPQMAATPIPEQEPAPQKTLTVIPPDHVEAEPQPEPEIVTLAPRKDGWFVLAGSGLNIARANFTEDDKADLGIKYEGGVFILPASKGFNFIDRCKKYGVNAVLVEPNGV